MRQPKETKADILATRVLIAAIISLVLAFGVHYIVKGIGPSAAETDDGR